MPLDGWPFGEQALPLALAIARRADAAIEVVQVLMPLAAVYASIRPEVEAQFRLRGHEYLDGVVRRLPPTAAGRWGDSG